MADGLAHIARVGFLPLKIRGGVLGEIPASGEQRAGNLVHRRVARDLLAKPIAIGARGFSAEFFRIQQQQVGKLHCPKIHERLAADEAVDEFFAVGIFDEYAHLGGSRQSSGQIERGAPQENYIARLRRNGYAHPAQFGKNFFINKITRLGKVICQFALKRRCHARGGHLPRRPNHDGTEARAFNGHLAGFAHRGHGVVLGGVKRHGGDVARLAVAEMSCHFELRGLAQLGGRDHKLGHAQFRFTKWRAGGNPVAHRPPWLGAVTKFLAAFVVEVTRRFAQKKTALGIGKIKAATTPLAGDGGVVGGRVIAQKAQFETALPRGRAVAFAGVATGLRETRQNVRWKMPRAFGRRCEHGAAKKQGDGWPRCVHFFEWRPMKARPAFCA